MQKQPEQNALLEGQFQQAQALLQEGRLGEGCQRLMELYNQGYNQQTIYSWLYEQSVEPNEEVLEQIYQENREQLDKLYPQYFLPPLSRLFYRAFPLENGEFALFDSVNKRFIYEDPDDVQLLHLILQADTLSEALSEEQEAVLAEMNRRYVEFARQLFDIADRMTEILTQPSPELLSQIELLRDYNPYEERNLLLLGKYYLQLRDFQKAELYLNQYMQTNQHSLMAIFLMIILYREQGRKLEELQLICKTLLMRGKIFGENSEAVLESYHKRLEELKKELPEAENLADLFSYMGNFLIFPSKRLDLFDGERGSGCAAGTYIFHHELHKANWNQFIGFAPVAEVSIQLERVLRLKEENSDYLETKFNSWSTFKLDTRPSKTFKEWRAPREKVPMLYAVMGTNHGQKLQIHAGGKDYEVSFPPYVYRDLRLKPGAEIKSNQPFIIAKPVRMGHHPRHKKLCLNIFLDAGSYQYLRSQDFSCVPNIRAFFEKGIIFDNNYTTGEYTWPVYPTLMTGTYLHRHQFYLDKAYTYLSENIPTLADRFSKENYYCFAASSSLSGASTGILRSFDKILSQSGYTYPFQNIVNDLIEQLEAYRETDTFAWFYSLELHKIFNETLCPLFLQTHEPFEKIYGEGAEVNTASVHQKYSWRKTQHYHERWKLADFWLGVLFRYIEEHYQPEDYVVTLFSDHGVTAVDNEEFLLKPSHTRSCFMVRGAGVPERGIVRDEMTSAVDLYPTVCHLAGVPYEPEKIDGVLPKAFGGPGREYALTESLFPGQTYKLCVRDLKYELRFLADAKTLYDGHVNLDKYTATLFDRETLREIDAPEEKKRMMREVWRHVNPLRSLDPPPTGEEEEKSEESAEDLSQVANL